MCTCLIRYGRWSSPSLLVPERSHYSYYGYSWLHTILIHQDCVCLFSGKWGGGRKKHITLTRRKKTLADADRQVSSQPLMFSKSVFNLRKLSEMPFHLIHSDHTDRLARKVLFNFEWIYGKVRGQSLNEVLDDYSLALEVRPDLDVRCEMVEALQIFFGLLDNDVQGF